MEFVYAWIDECGKYYNKQNESGEGIDRITTLIF